MSSNICTCLNGEETAILHFKGPTGKCSPLSLKKGICYSSNYQIEHLLEPFTSLTQTFFWLTVLSIYVRFRLNSELIQCVYWMNICSFGSTSNGRQVAIQSEYKRNAETSGYHPTYGLLWFLKERAENVDEEERRLHLEPLGSNGKMLS